MRTVVYQSFRTKDVPAWIQLCLESVRGWAKLQGFEYRFFDDGFFELVPAELRPRASVFKCLLADYARLVAARNLLKEGFDRAIWFDADALIFAPEKLAVSIDSGYAFCREVFLERIAFGLPHFKLYVNNAVSVFCRDEKIIDFALDCADRVLRSDQKLLPTSIGTEFLSKLQNAHAFPLLTEIGLFGSEMSYRYLIGDGKFLRPYLADQLTPIYAVNLCLSLQGKVQGGQQRVFSPEELVNLVERLKSDRGHSLNAWYAPNPTARTAKFDRPLSRYVSARQAVRSLVSSIKGY